MCTRASWSDTHQLNIYLDDYHAALDRHLEAHVPGSEMITELHVSPARLTEMMDGIREDFLRDRVELIYGTIRLIRKDADAFLKWAKADSACVIFNLHVDHHPAGMARARAAFRRLIDRAIACGGTYFLTYHRYATRDQPLQCYPEFPEFLSRQQRWDPEQRFFRTSTTVRRKSRAARRQRSHQEYSLPVHALPAAEVAVDDLVELGREAVRIGRRQV